MENIAAPLLLILFVRRQIERGHSVRSGLELFIANSQSEWVLEVRMWLMRRDQGATNEKILSQMTSQRQILLSVLEKGLAGQSVLPLLIQLQDDFVEACEAQIQQHVQSLPFKLMIPLFLFIFPAFLILLLGPLLL